MTLIFGNVLWLERVFHVEHKKLERKMAGKDSVLIPMRLVKDCLPLLLLHPMGEEDFFTVHEQ